MKGIRWGLLALLLLAPACAPHLKAGDRAAALEDWKRAEMEYRRALQSKPSDPVRKSKWENAKQEAFKRALIRSKRCIESRDLECARQEAEYALKLDETSAEAEELRKEIVVLTALERVEQARTTARTDPKDAFRLLKEAREMSAHDSVQKAVGEATPEILSAGSAEVMRLRDGATGVGDEVGASLQSAIALLGEMVTYDAGYGRDLTAVKAQYEKWVAAEYERRAALGDEALKAKDWVSAVAHYDSAEKLRAGGRAGAPLSYATLIIDAEKALDRKDFAVATTNFRQASEMVQDKDKYARDLLNRVEVRPYRIRLASVLVSPVRPDGQQWVGPPSPVLGEVTGMLVGGAVGFMAGGVGAGAGATAGMEWGAKVDKILQKIPPDNRPTVFVEVTLPDGRKISTTTKKNLYVSYDASFVVASNHFDERPIVVQVKHRPSNGSPIDIGAVTIPLKDLVSGSGIPATQSLLNLQFTASPDKAAVDGMFSGMSQVRTASNQADAFSSAAPGSEGYRLVRVEAGMGVGDYTNELTVDGSPDLQVVIEQGGRVVYQSPGVDDRNEAWWTPEATYLFLRKDETLVVRLRDIDPDIIDTDDSLSWKISAKDMIQGPNLPTSNSGYVRLRLEPRPVGP